MSSLFINRNEKLYSKWKRGKKVSVEVQGSTRYGFKSRYVRWGDQMISRWLAQAYRPKQFKLEVEKKIIEQL